MTKRILAVLALVTLLAPGTWAQTSYTTAQEVLAANIEATGGEDAWEGIASVHMVQEMVLEMPQGLMMSENKIWILFPDYMLMKTVAEGMGGGPSMNSTIYVTPEGGWMDGPMGREEIPDSSDAMAARMRSLKEEVYLLEQDEVDIALMPNQQLGEQEVYVVQVGGAEGPKRMYDTTSLLLVGLDAPTGQGGTAQMRFRDYRDVEGVMMSHLQEVEMEMMGMSMSQTMTLSVLTLNPALDPAALEQLATGEGQ